jgi:hypothetical protein
VSKGKPSRRGLINVALNGLVSTGVIGGFRTNYEMREEPDALRITVTRADGANAAAVQTEVLKALGRVGEAYIRSAGCGHRPSRTRQMRLFRRPRSAKRPLGHPDAWGNVLGRQPITRPIEHGMRGVLGPRRTWLAIAAQGATIFHVRPSKALPLYSHQ